MLGDTMGFFLFLMMVRSCDGMKINCDFYWGT